FGVDLDKDGVIGEAIKIQGISDESIQNNINSFLSDNLFTHQELKSLLVDVASGGVTATELTDLQTIETNLSGYLSATDDSYQSYIFDAVVNGNTANQWWTGGESSRISLGNLSEGASEDHLNSLVDKWYGGLDRPTNFVQGDSAASASAMTFDYYEMVGDLFVDGVNFDDVRQGQAGTCYVLAAACSYADADSSIITEMFKDNGDGTYGVRFYDNSLSEVWVTVDSYVPSTNGYSTALAGNASWGLSGEKWVSLLEKGYAQANETGAFSRGSDSSKNSYAAVEGGWMDALTHLSGNTTTTVSLNYTGTGGSGTGLNGWTNAWGSQTSWNAFESQAIAAINNNKALWLGSFGNTWGSNGRRDFVAGHAFAITDYNASTGLFTIVNPWGSSSGSSNHTFTARWSELATYGLDPIVSWA
ncbi:C2 family cysteine protease, partial [Synechococcus sp. MIT S9504]